MAAISKTIDEMIEFIQKKGGDNLVKQLEGLAKPGKNAKKATVDTFNEKLTKIYDDAVTAVNHTNEVNAEALERINTAKAAERNQQVWREYQERGHSVVEHEQRQKALEEAFNDKSFDNYEKFGTANPTEEQINRYNKLEEALNEASVDENGNYFSSKREDLPEIKKQESDRKIKEHNEALRKRIESRRQQESSMSNIEKEQNRAEIKQRQAEVDYENKTLLGRKITDIFGNAPVITNESGQVINPLASRKTTKGERNKIQKAWIEGKIEGNMPTFQDVKDNYGNRFDIYGGAYDITNNPKIGQSFFQGLGYDGIGDFAKNNQLITAGAIAGTTIGVGGIASAIGNRNRE